jgi:flagellar L-ring protein FlgH
MNRSRYILLLLAGAMLLFATACSSTRTATSPMPALTPPPLAEAPDPVANPGSLYNDAEADFLFSDNRARKVGDIVLVNIVENTKGKNKADTTAQRDSSIGLGVNSFFNKDKIGLIPFAGANILGMKGNTGSTKLVEASSISALKGKGETTRESTVTATVASRVVRLLPGGVMQVEGARETKVNDETQILVVRGLVRSQDIGPDNAVPSTYLADARIEYYGKGVIADKQRPGWLTRILENVWPF